MSEAITQAIRSKPVLSGIWNWRRMIRISALTILLLIAGGIITLLGQRLLAGTSPNEVRVTTFQDWRVVCPALTPTTPNCALTSDVTRDTGGVLVTLSMTDPTAGSTLSLTVPHGVLLEPGLAVTIGSDPMRVRPYETCTNVGCIAFVTVDADTLKSLRTSPGGQITVAAPNNTQPVNIPFSLKGFSDGFATLEREHARRTGIFKFLARS
jgi:invasion protein IalB